MWKHSKIIGSNQKRGEAGQERGHKDFVMSRSQLVAFAECPDKWLKGEDVKEETKSMTFGSVLDCLATTPDELLSRYVIAPAKYQSKGMQCPVCKTITDSAKCRGCKTDRVPVTFEKDWDLKSTTCQKFVDDARANGKQVVTAGLLEDAKKAFGNLHSNQSVEELIACSEK